MKNLIGRTTLVVCLLFSASPMWAQAKSPEELITLVLRAIDAKDAQSLKTMAISDADVRKIVWPAVASRVAGNDMTAEKFATNYEKSSNETGIPSLFAGFGGRKWQVVKVSLPQPLKQTKSYTLYAAPSVTVKGEDGQEKTVTVVGGVLDQGGVFKVSTYYVARR